MLRLLNFAGNPNLGVFARASESHAFLPPSVSPKHRREVEDALGVPLVPVTVGGTSLVGSLLAANRHAIVVADFATPRELGVLRKAGPRVVVLADRLNAAGNNLLVTDQGGLCNPDYPDATVRRLEAALGVSLHRATLAGLGNVGMAGVATPHGILVHPKSTPEERDVARRAFGREVMVGTINHGTGLVGAGLVANARGAIIGDASTTLEISRVEDALGFLPVPAGRP